MLLSACILTKNSKLDLEALIPQLTGVDEIVLIDDFSTDGTATWAREQGLTVYRRQLRGNFAKQRNFGLKKAKGKWVLFIDADERVEGALMPEILRALEDPQADGYYLRRLDRYRGKLIKHGEVGATKLLRLGRKGMGWWLRPVHEVWQIKKAAKLKTPLIHLAHSGPHEFALTIKKYAQMEAEYRFSHHYPWSLVETITFPLGKWVLNYLIRFGWLDGTGGLTYAHQMARHSWLTRVKLYQLYFGMTGRWKPARMWRWGFYLFWGLVTFGQLTRIQLTPTVALYGFEGLMGVLIITGWLISLKLGHKRWSWPKLTVWTVGFWLSLGLSLAANWPGLGFLPILKASLYWWRLGLYFLFAVTVKNMYLTGVVKLPITRILGYVGMGVAVLGLSQYLVLPDLRWLYAYGWDDHYFRLTSTLLDPGFTGLILALTVLLIEWRGGSWRRASWLLAFGAMLLTYARSAFGAYLLGELVMGVKLRRMKLFGMRVAILGLTLLLLPRPPSEGVRLERTFSITARATSMVTAMDVFKANPIFGVGFNAYRYFTQPAEASLTKPAHPSAPDNSYIFILATAGIVGFLGFLGLTGATLYYYRKNALILASLTAVGVNALANNSLFYPFVLIWLGALLGQSETTTEKL